MSEPAPNLNIIDAFGDSFTREDARLAADHLDPRDIAVLLEIGNEKLRYLTGVGTSVNAKGETHTISLGNIYAEATECLGLDLTITEAIYS